VTEDTCTACNGSGWVNSPIICSACKGSGSSDSWATRLPPVVGERINMTPCDHCRGTGYVDVALPCPVCNGTGQR
jgi:DnaJ-class molecular chaperone